MGLKAAIRKEPIAALSLAISGVTAAVSSPLFLDWYLGPRVVLEANFENNKDPRCAPFKLTVRNDGSRAADNVVILYEVDTFTSRGDIEGVYRHDEFSHVMQNVEYVSRVGEVRIPKLLPGQMQEFVYSEQINDADTYYLRQQRVLERDKALLYFPRITLSVHDHGRVLLRKVNATCDDGR